MTHAPPLTSSIGLRRRRSHLYRCGNCGETFKRDHELEAHECPIVEIERQIARWNQSFLATLDDDGVRPLVIAGLAVALAAWAATLYAWIVTMRRWRRRR